MKYMLLLFSDEKGESRLNEADMNTMMASYKAYAEALGKAGAMVGGERLRPSSDATQVRISDGKTEVLNGPYAETREQLGGYFIIEAANLDAALAWAARCPGASHGTIEVRPIWEM